jgi:hypothetical protein
MQKTARLYQDTRTAAADSNLDRLNSDLNDVTRIMTKNMEELLWRGDSLDSTKLFSASVLIDESYCISRDVTSVVLATHRVGEVP